MNRFLTVLNVSLVTLLILGNGLFAQVYFTGNALLSYGEGKQGYFINETLINTNIQFGRVTAWIQFEFSDPPEIGLSMNKLRKIRLDYSDGPIRVQLGDFYEIWGRGLILNQRDDQTIDLDNGLRGTVIDYQSESYDMQLLIGKGEVWKSSVILIEYDNRIPNYRIEHNVLGFNIDKYISNLKFSLSFLQSHEKHPIPFNEYFSPDTISLIHRLHGFRLEGSASLYDYYFEYVDKKTRRYFPLERIDKPIGMGNGFIGNLNLYPGVWSFNIEYKKYDFSRQDPINQWDIVNDYNTVLDYQQPPTMIREPATTLLGRLTHQVDFNNEVGYQIDIRGPIGDIVDVQLHYATASRGHSWISEQDGFQLNWFESNGNQFLPLKEPYANPFYEYYFEIDGYLRSGKLHYNLGGAYTEDVLTLLKNTENDSIIQKRYEVQKAITIPTSLDYYVNGYSFEIKYEWQKLVKGLHIYQSMNDTIIADSLISEFVDDSFKPIDYQKNYILSIGIGKSPAWSMALLVDGTSVDESFDPFAVENINFLEKFIAQYFDIENKWISLEFIYNFTPMHRLSLLYGSQRGGLVCSNGVCRFVPAFEDGFKLNFTAIF